MRAARGAACSKVPRAVQAAKCTLRQGITPAVSSALPQWACTLTHSRMRRRRSSHGLAGPRQHCLPCDPGCSAIPIPSAAALPCWRPSWMVRLCWLALAASWRRRCLSGKPPIRPKLTAVSPPALTLRCSSVWQPAQQVRPGCRLGARPEPCQGAAPGHPACQPGAHQCRKLRDVSALLSLLPPALCAHAAQQLLHQLNTSFLLRGVCRRW